MRSRFIYTAGRLAALAFAVALAASTGCSAIVESVLSEDGGGGGLPPGSEICDNGEDDDGDGLIDCVDDDCVDDPFCGGGGFVGEAACGGGLTPDDCCNDGVDNNRDGLTDCDDPDCMPWPICAGGVIGEADCSTDSPHGCCNNGGDDDGDGRFDCDDPDCGALCMCEAWLGMPVIGSNPPADAIGIDFQCQCGPCSGRWEACLAGEDRALGTEDDPPPEWCLAAAVCRSNTRDGGPSGLPWGCGRVGTSGNPQPGSFSPNACPGAEELGGSDLTAAAMNLVAAAQTENTKARHVLSGGTGRAIARCLCDNATACGSL